MLKALEKRPVSSDDVENALNHIKSQLRATGEREVPTKLVGNLVMDALKKLDKVAYIRFASVYRSFEDVREFGEDCPPARLKDLSCITTNFTWRVPSNWRGWGVYHRAQSERRLRYRARRRNCR